MGFQPSTNELLSALDTFSGHRLSRRDDLGALIDLASASSQAGTLDDLSFQGKFISKCYGIMARVGTEGNGYDRLAAELARSLTKAKDLLNLLLQASTSDTRRHFASTYLGMTPESFQNLLALCNDLSWYKSWHLDVSHSRK